jgi:hypothetical protein
LDKELLVNVLVVEEAFAPFTFHWYVAEGEQVPAAVNVIDVPEQTETVPDTSDGLLLMLKL